MIKINLWSWFKSSLPEVTGQIISVFSQEKVKSAPNSLTCLAKVPSSSTPQDSVCGPLPSAGFSHPVLTVHLPERWSCFTQIGLCLPLVSEAWIRKREKWETCFHPLQASNIQLTFSLTPMGFYFHSKALGEAADAGT